MKKIFISGVSLEAGGIEKALVILIHKLVQKGYEVTLGLEKKQGIFLKEIENEARIIEYRPSTCKIVFIRKMINLGKRIGFLLRFKNRFDSSISYATYSLPGSFMAKTASENSVLWVHSNYYILLGQDEKKVEDFFHDIDANEFTHLAFVSEDAKEAALKICPELRKKAVVCHNFMDIQTIKELAEEPIAEKKENVTTFLHVGRHTEEDKKITRIIEAAEKLKKEGFSFQVLLVGEGKADELYQDLVKEKGLQDIIFFLGMKKNPYPYFKISDALILSSEYEGYPVVYQEAIILELPIITTAVSDSKQIIENKYGLVVEKSTEGMYQGMKGFLQNGYEIREKFDFEVYEHEIWDIFHNLTQKENMI